MAASRPIGFAVVGLGQLAQAAVLPAFARAKRHARLVALVSQTEEKRSRLAAAYRVPHAFSFEQLDACLAHPDVEALYVALPNALHAQVTERAARAGVHVLCERPMATSEEECRAMISACREAEVRLMIAYRSHFDRATLAMLEAAQSGGLGEPRLYSAEFGYPLGVGAARAQRGVGSGVAWDAGISCINSARLLFGDEPVEVTAFSGAGSDRRSKETSEAIAVILRFPDDRLATFVCSHRVSPVSALRLVGEHGELRMENPFQYAPDRVLRLRTEAGQRVRRFAAHDQFAAELVAFARAVRKGVEPEPSGEEGLADVRVVRAVLESAQSGRAVQLEPFARSHRPHPEQAISTPRLKAPRAEPAPATPT